MDKISRIAFVAFAAAMLAGCGGGPKIPSNAIAAAYVDVEKLVWNAYAVSKDFISEMPKERRKEAKAELNELIDRFRKDFDKLDPEWALTVVTLANGGIIPFPVSTIVLKCDCEKKLEGGASLEEFAPMAIGAATDAPYGETKVWVGEVKGFGTAFLAFVDGKYAIASGRRKTLEQFISLYRDGEGEESEAFGEITDIEDDTVARVRIADAATLADAFGIRKQIEDFGERCGDEDLAEMLLEVGNLTLDVDFSDDWIGATLAVDAGSRDLARVFEGLFGVVSFAGRIGTDAGVGFVDMLEKFTGKEAANAAVSAAELLRKAATADRNGCVATLDIRVDTEDLLELAVPAMFGEGK